MRHSQLRAFHFVAKTGGFTRAAAAMKLTQPAVSDQVRKLETDYDIRLFNREKRQVSLTKSGEELLEITNHLFEVEAQAFELLSTSRAKATGQLRIIADSAHHISKVLARFRSTFPKVSISMRTGNSEDVLAALRLYEADIGILGNMNPHPEFNQIKLGTSPIVAFAAVGLTSALGTKAGLQEIAKHNLILREEGSKTRQKLEEAAAKQGIKLNATIEAEGREAVHEIVASGAGIGFVSKAEYGQDTRVRSIQIEGPVIPMQESVACLSQRKDVRLIRAFMDIVRA